MDEGIDLEDYATTKFNYRSTDYWMKQAQTGYGPFKTRGNNKNGGDANNRKLRSPYTKKENWDS